MCVTFEQKLNGLLQRKNKDSILKSYSRQLLFIITLLINSFKNKQNACRNFSHFLLYSAH